MLAAATVVRSANAFSDEAYSEISYPSGGLTIAAYLYRPRGPGPFPTIIYNHGSRLGQERQSIPWSRIAGLFVDAGYAVLVPERRGYGRSGGTTFSEAVGGDAGTAFVARLAAEADDVLAAASYLRTVTFVDVGRLGVTGWSFGGIVTMFAISRSDSFHAALDQAGGALSWRRSPALQSALIAAARRARCPVLMMDAENDATTEAVSALDQVMAAARLPHKMVIYPPFTPANTSAPVAPGHLLFSGEGLAIWGPDAIAFFDDYLKR
jgi:carboxymethylenebutenolidase